MKDIEQLLDMPDETPQAGAETADEWLAELSAPAPRSGPGWTILAFAGGLLLGWLLIGWWLWPVQWTNASPWDLQPRYQEKYVSLVAAQYWQSSDVEQAREALAGWDDEVLARILTAMESEASGVEAGQQLAALREALALPEGDLSLWTLLLRQRAILWSITLVLAVLCVAIGIVAAQRVLRAIAVRGSGRALSPAAAEDRPAVLEEREQAVLLEAIAEAEAEIEDLVEPEDGETDRAGAEDQEEATQVVELAEAAEEAEAAGAAEVNEVSKVAEATQGAESAQEAEPAEDSEAAQAKKGEKAKGTGKAEQEGAESMMEMLARGEKSEDGLDLSDIDVGEGLLEDLFTAESNDERFEVIRPMLEEVYMFNLMEETSRVLSQLEALHRDPIAVPDRVRT